MKRKVAEQETAGRCFASPELATMTRRQLLAWLGSAAGAATLNGRLTLLAQESPPSTRRTPARVKLPSQPSHNPAYQALPIQGDGILLWTIRSQGAWVGYGLNRNGKYLWTLCNGQRSQNLVAEEYSRMTRRAKDEAKQFLQQMLRTGVIVCGGYITVIKKARSTGGKGD